MWKACLLVGMGGLIGAVLRYLLGLLPSPEGFPVVTLAINGVGAFALGFFAALGSALCPGAALFLKTGLCGGFTTFSTFSLEAFTLMESGKIAAGLCYIGLSVIFGLVGIWAGMTLCKTIVT